MAHVILLERRGERETVVAVRSLRTWRVLFATVGLGETGAALALIEAVSYCGRNGHTIVTPEGGVIEREGEAA
jgi:hypothetical protein